MLLAKDYIHYQVSTKKDKNDTFAMLSRPTAMTTERYRTVSVHFPRQQETLTTLGWQFQYTFSTLFVRFSILSLCFARQDYAFSSLARPNEGIWPGRLGRKRRPDLVLRPLVDQRNKPTVARVDNYAFLCDSKRISSANQVRFWQDPGLPLDQEMDIKCTKRKLRVGGDRL